MLTKRWKLELTLATNFGSHAQMATKFGGQILATKFGFVPDWLIHCGLMTRYNTSIVVNTGPGNGLLPGPRLNIKTVLSTYGDFHVKDKTAVRTSYL